MLVLVVERWHITPEVLCSNPTNDVRLTFWTQNKVEKSAPLVCGNWQLSGHHVCSRSEGEGFKTVLLPLREKSSSFAFQTVSIWATTSSSTTPFTRTSPWRTWPRPTHGTPSMALWESSARSVGKEKPLKRKLLIVGICDLIPLSSFQYWTEKWEHFRNTSKEY